MLVTELFTTMRITIFLDFKQSTLIEVTSQLRCGSLYSKLLYMQENDFSVSYEIKTMSYETFEKIEEKQEMFHCDHNL
jgi:hypothetical protein